MMALRARFIGTALKASTCLAGVLFIALAACTSPQDSDASNPESGILRLADVAVATVNGSTIYDTDVNRAAVEQGIVMQGEALAPSDTAYSGVLDELIDQRLLALRAREQKLHETPEGRRRLAVSQEQILGNIIVEDHLAATVTDEAARKLYEAQIKLRQSGDEVRVSHVLVATQAEAAAVAKRLDEGESFAKVAFDVSIDRGTQSDGGDLGYFQADAMVGAFSTTVFAMKTGETSPPFETQFGWHIARLIDRRAAPPMAYEDMRYEIINYMTYDEIKSLLDSLRETADIDVLAENSEDEIVDDVVDKN